MRANWDVFKTRILPALICILLFSAITQTAFSLDRVKLATTTSIENTGLLAILTTRFEKKTGIRIDSIAVGSGKALKLAEMGDVDVVLAHSRKAEDEFIAKGFGLNPKNVMYNDFIILGPVNDPAGVKQAKSTAAAFNRIYSKKALFISRGDDSGTHKKELELWEKSGIKPSGSWYREIGQSQEMTIIMANNLKGYTLSDRGTYIALKKRINLDISYQKDPPLINYYRITAVNPDKFKSINHSGAMTFINWLTSDEGQKIIKNYKIKGEQLFYPNASY